MTFTFHVVLGDTLISNNISFKKNVFFLKDIHLLKGQLTGKYTISFIYLNSEWR